MKGAMNRGERAERGAEPGENNRPKSNVKVLLTTDGTYPCYTGGVSVWCEQLVRHSPDVTFRIFALTYSPSERPVYAMPPNVEACQILPLWGVREAGWAQGPFSQTYRRKMRTTSASLRP